MLKSWHKIPAVLVMVVSISQAGWAANDKNAGRATVFHKISGPIPMLNRNSTPFVEWDSHAAEVKHFGRYGGAYADQRAQASKGTANDTAVKEVEASVAQWFVVLNAMLNGDPTPFVDLYSHADDVTYMGAEGTYRIGYDAAYSDWTAQAKKSTGGNVTGKDIHIVVNGNMACAQHYTVGSVRKSDGSMTKVVVRESSVFRKEDDQWKMIAHHADGLPFWEKAFDE